jgi:hypothetical protein
MSMVMSNGIFGIILALFLLHFDEIRSKQIIKKASDFIR